jgi:hypothetical protein
VLLIPVGVWCWVRPGGGEEIIQSDVKETAPASKTAGKSNKRPVAGVKRKPVKTGSGASLPPATIDMGGRPRLVVESDPPPAAVAAPTAAATSASQLVAKPAAQVSEEFDEPQKPKKGIWRTLFHRK